MDHPVSSSSHAEAVLRSLHGSVPEKYLNALRAAIGQDAQISPNHEPHSRLETIEKNLNKVLTRLETQGNPIPSRPRPHMIRYSLYTSNDVDLLKNLKNSGIVEKFRRAESPFNQIRGCKIWEDKLGLFVNTAEAGQEILEKSYRIGRILSLDPECRTFHDTYCVRAFGFEEDKNDPAFMALPVKEWNSSNGVTISKARWTYKLLILELGTRGDAEKLCRGPIYLSGHVGWAEPFDRRSTPKFCFRCGKPGHLQNRCKNRTCCMICAGFDHKAPGCKKPRKCINCGNSHATFDPVCQNKAVLDMRADCEYHREKGPSWAQGKKQACEFQQSCNHPSPAKPSKPVPKSKKRVRIESPTREETLPVSSGMTRRQHPIPGSSNERPNPPSEARTLSMQLSTSSPVDSVAVSAETPSVSHQIPSFSFNSSMRGSLNSSQFGLHTNPPESQAGSSSTSDGAAMFKFTPWDPKINAGPKGTRIRRPAVTKKSKNNDPMQFSIDAYKLSGDEAGWDTEDSR
ncbi:hypothetical protein P153DRAFT_399410 [Dothidotthia symphoricarpi CBS 119687]|uniref:CCHC-type domain-containing protein n=1 Tax=Dothidotthia symphoricarpi CBS 119687 TaxID=1392245 RepID=A0A6A6A7M3_9PLEO|nr:uncharacterized protein P153DRAFT_399410 [Dothidotthia symphoricarpi CBS 119687]KAF2126651.1 hypothetical protein P153DRAFT_399410 [Dothidotthia symphoricarpi CBS 119687]